MVVAPGRMLDNVLPESLPFDRMVLKLACVHIHAHNLQSRSGGGFEGLQRTRPDAGVNATPLDRLVRGLGPERTRADRAWGSSGDPPSGAGRVRRAGARQIGSVGGRPLANLKVRGHNGGTCLGVP
jgi:hypothetical protein